MTDYTLAIGTRDPLALQASSEAEALEAAARLVRERFPDDLQQNPQEVATLLGPNGLMTAPGECLDAFVSRAGGRAVGDPDIVAPGQTDSPDCNGG